MLDEGRRDRIRVPGDVQDLVDVGFDTSDDANDVEAQARSLRQMSAGRRAIPSPASLRSVGSLTEGSGELPLLLTRLGADSVEVIPVGGPAPAWMGDLPASPDRDTQRDLLDHVVPVPKMGRPASVLKLCEKRPETWTSARFPLLSGIRVLDLEARSDHVRLDPKFGLVVRDGGTSDE
ncbi:MAG: hypothetical protein R2698_14010 [Microthrixaceae bacterium]